jgi:3-methyladenine DNA glycosylase AlkD
MKTKAKLHINARKADELGERLATLLRAKHAAQAYTLLAPVLAQRTPFALLDRIGRAVGAESLSTVNAFVEEIADRKTEGGWVVIASALGQQMRRDHAGAFKRCRKYVIAADVWYAADILGERVPGPAVVADFAPALALLEPWREDANRWVRRTVGVAVHFWAKRSYAKPESSVQAKALLDFLEPMFEEHDTDAIKGVGWGLKTLGKHYPALVSEWLADVVQRRTDYRALMLRKAMTYLPAKQRASIVEAQ